MIGIIGKKLGMTQIFDENGQQIPVTVVEAAPNPVVQVIDRATVGYASVQLGWGERRVARESATKETAARPKSGRARKGAASKERTPRGRRATKAAVGHAAKAGLNAPPKVLCSFRLDDASGKTPDIPTYTIGDRITVELFAAGDRVKVTGTTKGRGFQGVVKRHGFAGGPNTHGNTKHRRPGSIGPGTDPSRVIKGKKMPGHFGAERATQTHLRVEKVDVGRNLIYIRGAIPGARNGIVTVRKQG